jgi:tetratricopeptide (TPR) repeat protein
MAYLTKRFWALRRGPFFWLLAFGLPALLVLGAYFAGRNFWAWYHFRAAQQAQERREFAQASAHLSHCLKIWPESAAAHILAARIARQSGRYEEAKQYLESCRQLEGWSEDGVLEECLLRAQRGDLARAGYLHYAIEHNHPDSVLILEALAQGYMRAYRLPEALRCLDLLLERQPNHSQAFVWQGTIWDRLQDPAQARASYQKAVDGDPENDEARLLLAQILYSKGQPAEAAEHLEYLRERQPENPAVLRGLASCRRKLGQHEEARKLLDALLARYPREPAILAERGWLEQDQGQVAEAAKWFRQSLDIAPHGQETNFALYSCLIQLGKKDEAEKYLKEAERIQGDFRRLAQVVADLVQSPHDASLRHEAGVILLRNGKEEEALGCLASALSEDPSHRPTHHVLADYYQRVGNQPRADYHRFLSITPLP